MHYLNFLVSYFILNIIEHMRNRICDCFTKYITLLNSHTDSKWMRHKRVLCIRTITIHGRDGGIGGCQFEPAVSTLDRRLRLFKITHST